MNLFFGIKSIHNSNKFDIMESNIESFMGASPVNLWKDNYESLDACGFISSGGELLGTASKDGIRIILFGFLQKPLPSWTAGSPIDKADYASRYLLTRYLKYGVDFLNGVNGNFVLAVSDQKLDRLILASDPIGNKKLFYHWSNGTLAYSTNIASLAAGYEPASFLDRSNEDFLLGYEFLPWNRTIYSGVKSVQKASMLILSKKGFESKAIQRSRSEPIKIDCFDENKISNLLHDKFIETINNIIPTTKKIAVLLGGFDSALIASVLVNLEKDVETFSFRFKNEQFNQKHIDTLQNFLNHKHTWVDIDADVIKDGLNHYSRYFNQPVSQMHYVIQTAYACSVIREKGYRHCLTGDGCDELFLGYPTVHFRAKLFEKTKVLPKVLINNLNKFLKNSFLENNVGHPVRILRNTIYNLSREMPMRGHITHRVFDEYSLNLLRNSCSPKQNDDIENILRKLAEGMDSMPLLRLAYHGKSSVGLNKNKIEGSSAVSGLTIQSPYQHPEFVRFTQRLPEALLRPDIETKAKSIGKYILLKMVEDRKLLPADIIYQKKASPVTAPVDAWYMNMLKHDILEAIDRLDFNYNKKYVKALLKPKITERLFREHVGISYYTSQAVSLLATYASYM